MPAAASTRPQFGSLPKQRALQQVRPGDRAADVDRLVFARSALHLDADAAWSRPRRRRSAAGHRSSSTGCTSRVQRRRAPGPRRWRRSPAAARCRWSTCSRRCRSGRASCGWPARSARVERRRRRRRHRSSSTQSIVARPGASMPAPLIMPPTVTPASLTATACLATVSVVRIASAAAAPPSAPSAVDGAYRRRAAAGPSAGTRRSGRCSRPRPRRHRTPGSSATCSAVWCVSAKPRGPVHAFAPPELRMTARKRPPVSTCRDHSTGAACTRLRGEDARRREVGPVVDHQRHIRQTTRLQPGRHAGGAESRGSRRRSRSHPACRKPRRFQAIRASGSCIGPPARRRPCRGCRWR